MDGYKRNKTLKMILRAHNLSGLSQELRSFARCRITEKHIKAVQWAVDIEVDLWRTLLQMKN